MSQQVTKEKYSIETLRERNVSYDHQHWLTQEDVDMANSYVELIERTRSKITPQIGDRLVYVTEHGDYYGNALIDSRSAKEGYLSVCEQPYVPFVWEEDGNIRLSVSGGAFHSVNPEELKFLKWTEGVFKDWGHCGACANGSVSFLAKVPLWFYAEPNPRYGDFTTETYRKFYLHKREESENGNLYQGFDIAFRDEAEFRQFLKDYEGTVFKGNWDNQIVLWCFRREYVFLPSAEWETFNAPIETRRLNFHPEQVKIVKDMEKHITYFYRKYSINSLVYWVTYVHNVVYSFYRSMIYCYINSTQRCAGSIVIDIIPTNGADKRKFFPFAPYFPVTNVIKRYFYPYFPAIIGIKGYSFPYFPYLSGIMKIKTALYSLFSRLDWHKTVVFPCLGEIYEGIRSLSWEIPVT